MGPKHFATLGEGLTGLPGDVPSWEGVSTYPSLVKPYMDPCLHDVEVKIGVGPSPRLFVSCRLEAHMVHAGIMERSSTGMNVAIVLQGFIVNLHAMAAEDCTCVV